VDPQEAQRRLEQMKSELEHSLDTLESEDAGSSTELTHVDNHPADTAGELQEEDRQHALVENAQSQIEQIDAALVRIAEGTYGRCVDCGRELPEERLEARPEAARCVQDQAKAELAARN
jgi:DnaK suppressor protein